MITIKMLHIRVMTLVTLQGARARGSNILRKLHSNFIIALYTVLCYQIIEKIIINEVVIISFSIRYITNF